jgi:ubiquitin-like 1-activating enzyme E1 A
MAIELSADELALYDRQLRVWGAEGQNHIKNASVLVINLNGVGTEIVKNLTLSGIGSIELWDHGVVCESDLSAQFFLNEDDLGKLKLPCVEARVKDMNPRVALTINTNPVRFSKENDLEYFKKFRLVIANNLPAHQLLELNEITRELKISLHVTSSHGLFGFMFNDLLVDITTYKKKKMPISRKVGPISKNQEIIKITTSFDKEKSEALEHITIKSSFKKFTDAIQSQNLTSLTRKQKKKVTPLLSIFISLHELQLAGSELTAESLKSTSASIQSRLGLNEIVDDSYFTSVIESLDAEISPVAAILGGALAQDVINFLSKKESPINNLLILDGDKFTMPIYEL